MITLTLAGMALGNPSDAQQLLNRRVTIQIDEQPIRVVLQQLGKTANVRFTYGSALFAPAQKAALRASDQPLADVLDKLLKPLSISYKVEGRQIILNRRVPETGFSEPLPEAKTSPTMQVADVSGTVTDENGAGLPGVSVVLKGTSRGSTTDVNGRYRLAVSADGSGAVLVFSFVGYQRQEVPIGGRSVVDVRMVVSDASLSEVVVVGYGTQNRRDVTSAITSVQGRDIQNVPVTSLDAVLQGKAAGVQVVQNSGAPGNEVYVRIRGNGSLFGENRPLYVIDGVPMNNIAAGASPLEAGGQRITTQNDINPADIESIEILKDAAAAAIYGSRAGNGVILITTKRGRAGRSKIDFNAYTGVASVVKRLPLLNGDQFVDLYQESINNYNATRPTGLPAIAIDTTVRKTGLNTNWQDEVFQDAPISNYALSIAGGADKIRHFISLGYFDQKGTVKGQEYNRFNGRINLDFNATDKLKIGVNLTASRSFNKRIPNDFSSESVMGLALVQNPNNPVYNPDGSYYRDRRGVRNPVQLLNEYRQQSIQNRYVGNIYGEYDIIPNLRFKTSLGFDHMNEKGDYYIPRSITNGNAVGAINMYETFLWVVENTLSYQKTIADNHTISALLGQSAQESTIRRFGAAGNNNATDVTQSISGFANRTEASDYRSTWGLVSYFGRVGYTFKDKYLLTGVLRIDGSSRFGANHRYGYFPSASVGWRVSEEGFMKGIRAISDLKLRASIGVTGNNEGLGNDFPSLATYGTGANYGALAGIAPQSLSYSDLTWEATTQTNLGVDISFFNDRLNFTGEAYLKTTNDLIFKLELPFSSGFARTFGANVGSLENKGLEFALNSRNLVGAFSWTTDFNLSINRNKITYLPLVDVNKPGSADFVEGLPNAYNSLGPQSIFRIGEPVGSFFGFRHLGINPDNGNYIFEDINKDGIITTDDRVILGNALPKHTGGFTNTFRYKGFELSGFLQWSYGNSVYNQTRSVLERMSSYNNQNTNTLRRWTPTNTNTDVPRAVWNDPNPATGQPNGIYSQRFIEDGSFLRIKNVTVGYTIPAVVLRKARINSARVYVSATNLLTFTNYSGYDPETQNQQFKNSQLGVDYITQPQPRTFLAGLSIGF